MTEPKDKRHDLSPDEEALARVYRQGAGERPPAALDKKIRAAAHAAVQTPANGSGDAKRWAVPFSVAALIVLSVGIVYELTRPPAPESYELAATDTLAEQTPFADAAKPETPADAKKSAPAATRERREVAAANQAQESTAPAAAPTARLAETEATTDSAAKAKSQAGAANAAPMKRAATVVGYADIVAVSVDNAGKGYRFAVTIRSPDSGCGQYADWWEVLNADGALLFRQVFSGSHATAQPFVSLGGPVPIAPDQVVWIRAHMNNSGYGGAAFRGSVQNGFVRTALDAGFAAGAAQRAPLPDKCTF